MQYTKPEGLLLASLVLLTGVILLTGLMPGDPKPGDPMPVNPIQAIYRYEMKRRKSWYSNEGTLQIAADSLSQDDKEWYTLYFSGNSGLTREAIEECESRLQLFVLVEKYPLENPGDYEDFTQIMQSFVKNILPIVIESENYLKRIFYLIWIIILGLMLDVLSLILLEQQIYCLYDLVKTRRSWTRKGGSMRLQIPDSLCQDEKKWITLYNSGDSRFTRAAIEKCESLLQLSVLIEKCTLIGPGDLEYFTKIIQTLENKAIVKDMEKYRAIERSSVHNIQLSSSPSFRPHQDGRVAYKTGNQSNMRSNSAPTFEGYTQNPSWGGQGYQGIPPSQQQQPYHNYPPQQYHQPQQQATTSFCQQNPHQWQHGQQPAIKTEPENRTSSAAFGLTVFPEMPKLYQWYHEAVQKNGAAYAVKLWEKLVQKKRVDEKRKKRQEMKIVEQRRVAESTPPVKTEPGDDEREAAVTRDLCLGPIEDTTRSQGHMPDLPRYKMDRLPRGLCIIFNAENFASKKLRVGTHKDVEALLNTFQNRLKFETRVVQDPTKKEYIECLQNIGRMDHSKFDCFVCIILSHGCEGHVCGTDGGTVSIDALTGLFRGDYVPSLVNKPKLFFIQACRGKYPQESVDIQQDDTASLPYISDTLVSYATIPGYASYRSAKRGSLFIISLCNIINTYYKEKVDLLSMLTMVNELMSRRAIEGKWMEMGKQIGIHSNILRKQIFFNEGLDE